MSQGTKFAIALVLFFMAGVGLFVAFHPNGLTNADGTPVTNAGEVIQWYINYLGNLGKGPAKPPKGG